LRQIHTEDVFGPSRGEFEFQGQRSKVKVTSDKNSIFGPFSALRAVYVWKNSFSVYFSDSVLFVAYL